MSDQLLAELVAWTRVNGAAPLKDLLSTVLRTKNDYAVHDATNGSKSAAEVAKAVGITRQAVGYKWARWRAIGLIFDAPGEAHPRHLASASDIGLEPPEK